MLQGRRSILQYLVLVAGALLLAACASSNPPTVAPTFKSFTQRNGVFSIQVPANWQIVQNDVSTESMAAFSQPDGHAELIAYTGLLDRRLTENEARQSISGLIAALLNSPSDLNITDLQLRSDGTYTTTLSFTRAGEKQSGTAIVRADPLLLSGVILDGPATDWASFLSTMQPALNSFKPNPEATQGIYFEIVEGDLYALAAPVGWESQPHPTSKKLRSPNGQLQISVVQQPTEKPLTNSELVDRGVRLGETTLGNGTVTGTEQLPDGRTKVTIDQGSKSTIGYLDQKGGSIIGLFFQIPADRLADYQPLIDFMYSTFTTGKKK